jgi:homoserine kinase
MRRVTAYGPACLGNLAAGFDTLGVALAPLAGAPVPPAGAGPGGVSGLAGAGRPDLWGDVVEITAGDEAGGAEGLAPWAGGAQPFSLVCEGPFALQLPADPAQNLAWKACAAFERRLGRRLPALAVRLYKGLPVAGGLGSSSATVVAVLRALDAITGHPLGDLELLAAAGEAEADAAGGVHLDNVAAALLGGVRLVDAAGGSHLLPFPSALCFVLASPERLALTTREARAALPPSLPLPLAVAHAQNLAALVHALHAGDRALLRACLRDLVAEPHRARLVPGFLDVQAAALAADAWGCSFSGAGPAIFAVAETPRAPAVGEAMRLAWEAAGVVARIALCTVDPRGARVLEDRWS